MAKYTPRPWEADHDVVLGPRGRVADCRETGHAAALDERQANARLIAAAPDLYEALTNITECAEAGADGVNMDLWIEQARAALAKAS